MCSTSKGEQIVNNLKQRASGLPAANLITRSNNHNHKAILDSKQVQRKTTRVNFFGVIRKLLQGIAVSRMSPEEKCLPTRIYIDTIPLDY